MAMNWEKANRREKARPVISTPTEFVYWLTIPKWPTRCMECGNKTDVIAFRASDRHSLCEICAERLGVQPQKSRRFIAATSGTSSPSKSKAKPKRNKTKKRRGNHVTVPYATPRPVSRVSGEVKSDSSTIRSGLRPNLPTGNLNVVGGAERTPGGSTGSG